MPPTRSVSRRARLLIASTLLAWYPLAKASAASPSPYPDPDPIEGKWYGMAGFPEDRVELGFEIRRGPQGELKVYLYEPVLNFYGLELPGTLERKGDTYVLESYVTSFRLADGRIEGTYMPLHDPMTLRRTDSLPAEVPVPDFPTGPGPRWQVKLGGQVWAAAAVRDSVAYVGTTSGVFNAVSLKDGSFVWTFNAGRPMHGEALATDDAVFFVCDNGFLYRLDRATGKEVWRYDLVTRSPPASCRTRSSTSTTSRRPARSWPAVSSTWARATAASTRWTRPPANRCGASRRATGSAPTPS
jgi:hypothetical protein